MKKVKKTTKREREMKTKKKCNIFMANEIGNQWQQQYRRKGYRAKKAIELMRTWWQ